ncbi:MAG: hypothetical protein WKF70_04220, partial [Chitinophagaceae bacterium]
MISPLTLTAFAIIFFSCEGTVKDTSQISFIHEASVAEKFKIFDVKFHEDSAFQLSRIVFPLDGQHIDGFEKKVWVRNSWTLMKVPVGALMDTSEFKRNIEMTDSSVAEKIWIEDSGFRVERIFKQRDGKWY